MDISTQLKRSAVNVKAIVDWYYYHHRYTRNIVFLIGLEKSGSTWLRNMFTSLPGFHNFRPRHNNSLDDSLRSGMFDPYRRRLAVIRLHTVWTQEDADILANEGVPYIVQYRDLRDTAVSWYFYVTKVQSQHVLHDKISAMTLEDGLDYYIDRLLPVRSRFIRDWRAHRDPEISQEVSYESLRANTQAVFGNLARFCFGDIPEAVISRAVEKNSFRQVTGRKPGEEDQTAFVRKGVTGDWRNYFTQGQKERFKITAGDLLIDLGYERDLNW